MNHVVGADGCKTGWVFAWRDGDQLEFKIIRCIADLLNYPNIDVVIIDIPIGLPYSGVKKRACDAAARGKLRFPRSASVFPPPCRDAIQIQDNDSSAYQRACSINKAVVGYKLSKQAFGLFKKIREVDDFVLLHSVWAKRLVEAHPELCFWALAGGPMKQRKKKREGVNERLDVLEAVWPGTRNQIYARESALRKEGAKLDDIIDAVVCLMTGVLGYSDVCSPEVDDTGLRMRIVHPRQ